MSPEIKLLIKGIIELFISGLPITGAVFFGAFSIAGILDDDCPTKWIPISTGVIALICATATVLLWIWGIGNIWKALS
jgi:hypothetical protein